MNFSEIREVAAAEAEIRGEDCCNREDLREWFRDRPGPTLVSRSTSPRAQR